MHAARGLIFIRRYARFLRQRNVERTFASEESGSVVFVAAQQKAEVKWSEGAIVSLSRPLFNRDLRVCDCGTARLWPREGGS